MKTALIVVENPANWPLKIAGVEVVAARAYLTDRKYEGMRHTRVFNLCRSYRYQSLGYYVSLLAQARGQNPLPRVTTIQDLKSQTLSRLVSEELDDLIQRSLAPIKSPKFLLSIYFGRNMAKRYDRLCASLFRVFQAPLLKAQFVKTEKWEMKSIGPVTVGEIPQWHRSYIVKFGEEFLAGRRFRSPRLSRNRYDLAILWDSDESSTASDERAIKRFIKAADSVDVSAEVIERSDYARLAEFDALFIRDTTNVNHYTYRFARRAAAEGLVVIDDPESILKCSNKVYLAELLRRHGIPGPRTVVVSSGNAESICDDLGFPCVLKQPDSSFSQGVTKVQDPQQLELEIERLLDRSELIIAQEFLPTGFDWRVGVIDREPVFVCKYHMAPRHWQIIKTASDGTSRAGRVEAIPMGDVPGSVLRMAVRAANLIGDGFYGVDVKQVGRRCLVIEVNDNPSVDAGYEDALLKDQLYVKIMSVFVKRLDQLKRHKHG